MIRNDDRRVKELQSMGYTVWVIQRFNQKRPTISIMAKPKHYELAKALKGVSVLGDAEVAMDILIGKVAAEEAKWMARRRESGII